MAIEVTAVVGACGPERQMYARWLARHWGAMLLQAEQITEDPNAVESSLGLVGRFRGDQSLVVEYPLQMPAAHVIGEIVHGEGSVVLTDVICVVDAAHLLADLAGSAQIRLTSQPEDESTPVVASRAERVVTQIEYASAVVLVNTGHMGAEGLNLILSLVNHLAPKAHLDLVESLTFPQERGWLGSFTEEQTHAGWLCLLNGDFTPRFEDPRVIAVRYEQVRPLHPGRFAEVIDRYTEPGESGMLLRSAGFAHLATRSHITAHWSQVGQQLMLAPAGFDQQLAAADEPLAFGQDLALLGLGIDADRLADDLDETALTDEELTAGPSAWATFPDPFPEWNTAAR